MHHQPALGHAIVTELKTLIAGFVIQRVPGVPREGLRDHLRDRAKGVGNACDKAEVFGGWRHCPHGRVSSRRSDTAGWGRS